MLPAASFDLPAEEAEKRFRLWEAEREVENRWLGM